MEGERDMNLLKSFIAQSGGGSPNVEKKLDLLTDKVRLEHDLNCFT